MKKKLSLLFLVLGLVLFFSCTDDDSQVEKVQFHCIWGWDGDNNGYFYLNNGQLGGSASLFAGGDNGNQATNKYKDLQYIANFRINRDKERVNL